MNFYFGCMNTIAKSMDIYCCVVVCCSSTTTVILFQLILLLHWTQYAVQEVLCMFYWWILPPFHVEAGFARPTPEFLLADDGRSVARRLAVALQKPGVLQEPSILARKGSLADHSRHMDGLGSLARIRSGASHGGFGSATTTRIIRIRIGYSKDGTDARVDSDAVDRAGVLEPGILEG